MSNDRREDTSNRPEEALPPFRVRIPIDDRPFDFLLTLARNGEFRAARALVYDLPAAAQQLILGPDRVVLDRKLYAHGRLFAYIVPLVLAGRLPAYRSALAAVSEHLKAAGRPQLPALLEASISHDAVDDIEAILQNLGTENAKEALLRIAYGDPEVATNFLPRVIPFLSIGQQGSALESFVNRQPERVRYFLIGELDHSSSRQIDQAVLTCFAQFTTAHDEVYAALLRYYERPGEKPPRALAKMLDALRHYTTERVKDIATKLLRSTEPALSRAATIVLLKNFGAADLVVKTLLPLMLLCEPRTTAAAVSALGHRDLADYLPGADVVIDVFARTLEKGLRYDLPIKFVGIAVLSRAYLRYDRIRELLCHDSKTARAGTLEFIGYITVQHRFSAYFSPRFTERYLQLTFDSDEKVFQEAVKLLAKAGYLRREPRFVGMLLDIFEREADSPRRRGTVLRHLNEVLPKVSYQPSIEPVLLPVLTGTDHSLRAAALRGLSYSRNRSIRRRLLTFQDDPDAGVREIATEIAQAKRAPGVGWFDRLTFIWRGLFFRLRNSAGFDRAARVARRILPAYLVPYFRWLKLPKERISNDRTAGSSSIRRPS